MLVLVVLFASRLTAQEIPSDEAGPTGAPERAATTPPVGGAEDAKPLKEPTPSDTRNEQSDKQELEAALRRAKALEAQSALLQARLEESERKRQQFAAARGKPQDAARDDDSANSTSTKHFSPNVVSLRDNYARLDKRAAALAAELRAVRQPEGAATEEDRRRTNLLRAVVQEAFDAGQELHQAELREFEQRMQRLQATFQQRRRNRDRIIDRRIDELLNAPLQWESDPEAATSSGARGSAPSVAATGSLVVAQLTGVWTVNLLPSDESKVPAEKRIRLAFWKDRSAVFQGQQLKRLWKAAVDLSHEPHRLSLTAIDSPESREGIFEVRGDGLRLNISGQPNERPTRFGTDRPEFVRIHASVPDDLLLSMQHPDLPSTTSDLPSTVPDLLATKGSERPKTPRKPFLRAVTVGVVSANGGNNLVSISCKEPGNICVGDELCLSREDVSIPIPERSTRLGWVTIIEMKDAETAIGRVSEMPRVLRNNRYVYDTAQPGNSVERPIYEDNPVPGN